MNTLDRLGEIRTTAETLTECPISVLPNRVARLIDQIGTAQIMEEEKQKTPALPAPSHPQIPDHPRFHTVDGVDEFQRNGTGVTTMWMAIDELIDSAPACRAFAVEHFARKEIEPGNANCSKDGYTKRCWLDWRKP